MATALFLVKLTGNDSFIKLRGNRSTLLVAFVHVVGKFNSKRIQLLILDKIKYSNYEVLAFDKNHFENCFSARFDFAYPNSSFSRRNSAVTDTNQFSSIQQALIIELNPQIMSAFRQKYRDNFLYANVHVLPIQGSDNVEVDFILEMTVMKGEWPEKVQMTFRREGLNGYKVDDINVITS